MKKILPTPNQSSQRTNPKLSILQEYSNFHSDKKEYICTKNAGIFKSGHVCSRLNCRASESTSSNSDIEERTRTKATTFFKAYPKSTISGILSSSSESYISDGSDSSDTQAVKYPQKNDSVSKKAVNISKIFTEESSTNKEGAVRPYRVKTSSSFDSGEEDKSTKVSDCHQYYISRNKTSNSESSSLKFIPDVHADENNLTVEISSGDIPTTHYSNTTANGRRGDQESLESSFSNQNAEDLPLERETTENYSADSMWSVSECWNNQICASSSEIYPSATRTKLPEKYNHQSSSSILVHKSAYPEYNNPKLTNPTRPFKTYPVDPLAVTIGFDTAKMSISGGQIENYNEFRRRMLGNRHINKSDIHKNMRRLYTADMGDISYREMRQRNNIAAKRSRDARRAKEDELAIRCAYLEQENMFLKRKVAELDHERQKLKSRWKIELNQ